MESNNGDNAKKTVKIFLPQLETEKNDQIPDVDSLNNKMNTKKGSGLLSMLPAPSRVKNSDKASVTNLKSNEGSKPSDQTFSNVNSSGSLLSFLPMKSAGDTTNESTKAEISDSEDESFIEPVQNHSSINEKCSTNKNKLKTIFACYNSSDEESVIVDNGENINNTNNITNKDCINNTFDIHSLCKTSNNINNSNTNEDSINNLPVKPSNNYDFFNLNSKSIFKDEIPASQAAAYLAHNEINCENSKNYSYGGIEENQSLSIDNIDNSYQTFDSDFTNDTELRRVCGRKKNFKNIQFMDVNQRDLCSKDIDKIKQLTSETQNYTGERVAGVARSKNHITYLAQQAKQNDMMLKSRWSNESMRRKRTFQRYGF